MTKNGDAPRWLVFFYSVPSKPVKNRMSVWRSLTRAGAVQLKDTVYILPYSHEHEEFLNWLIENVLSMGGEGAFLKTDSVEPLGEKGIINLFDETRTREYLAIEKEFSVLERRLDSMRKGGTRKDTKHLFAQFAKLSGNLEEMLKSDFFKSSKGRLLGEQCTRIGRKLSLLGSDKGSERLETIRSRRITDYLGRTWATRKRPFVDRMAAAWLIRRFIDPDAKLEFVDETEASNPHSDKVLFDIKGGEFTHVGDLCTFEVMVKSFAIKDRAALRIAEFVHELDIKDGKYPHPEAKGIEDILTGIRKTARDDASAMQKGIDVFEMLYQSFK